jgi:hypothetical protein
MQIKLFVGFLWNEILARFNSADGKNAADSLRRFRLTQLWALR